MSRRAKTAQAPSHVVQRSVQPSRTKTAPAAFGPSAYFHVMMFAEEREREQKAKDFMQKVQKRANHTRRARLTARSGRGGETQRSTLSTANSFLDAQRSALSTANSFLPDRLRSGSPMDPSEEAETRCRCILQRLVPGSLVDAFRAQVPDGTRASKAQSQQVLGSLLSYPGDADFDVIWRRFDPAAVGSIDFEEFAAQMEWNGAQSRPGTGRTVASRALSRCLSSRLSSARSRAAQF